MFYLVSIVHVQGFSDGNKRTGFIAAYMFLDCNGLTLTADEVTAAAMTLSLASSEINETDYAVWLAQNTSS